MLRRSSRLETTGYYNINGHPSISYKETLCRIFKRRRTRHHFNFRREETSRSGKCIRHFTFMTLFFGLLYLIFLLNSNSQSPELSESPVSPIIRIPDPSAQCKDLEDKKLREREEELLKLKKQMNSLFPAAYRLPNFALESLGANVIPHLTSESYQIKETVMTFFGIPFAQPPVHPRTVIQGHLPLPGRCWAFAGGKGHLVIALSYPVTISHVTLDHISKSLSPTGDITSAPKEFTVYGMEKLDDEGTQLGTFLYDRDGDPVQTFKTLENTGVFNYVKLQVESNWGEPHYSCLYSFRVHGKIAG